MDDLTRLRDLYPRTEESLHMIPEHMHGGVVRWVLHGIRGGSFLDAVLRNDLCDAVGRADRENKASLVNWAEFMSCCLPHPCWGSGEKVEAWGAHGGLAGLAALTDVLETAK